MRPRLLFVLQNAWRYGAQPDERDWDGTSWERALWACQTGKRLREYVPDGVDYDVINASREVANDGKTVHGADLAHVAAAVRRHRSSVVVLLGREAQRLQHQLYDVRIICLPHPCWRQLTKRQTAGYRDYLKLVVETGAGGLVNHRGESRLP